MPVHIANKTWSLKQSAGFRVIWLPLKPLHWSWELIREICCLAGFYLPPPSVLSYKLWNWSKSITIPDTRDSFFSQRDTNNQASGPHIFIVPPNPPCNPPFPRFSKPTTGKFNIIFLGTINYKYHSNFYLQLFFFNDFTSPYSHDFIKLPPPMLTLCKLVATYFGHFSNNVIFHCKCKLYFKHIINKSHQIHLEASRWHWHFCLMSTVR